MKLKLALLCSLSLPLLAASAVAAELPFTPIVDAGTQASKPLRLTVPNVKHNQKRKQSPMLLGATAQNEDLSFNGGDSLTKKTAPVDANNNKHVLVAPSSAQLATAPAPDQQKLADGSATSPIASGGSFFDRMASRIMTTSAKAEMVAANAITNATTPAPKTETLADAEEETLNNVRIARAQNISTVKSAPTLTVTVDNMAPPAPSTPIVTADNVTNDYTIHTGKRMDASAYANLAPAAGGDDTATPVATSNTVPLIALPEVDMLKKPAGDVPPPPTMPPVTTAPQLPVTPPAIIIPITPPNAAPEAAIAPTPAPVPAPAPEVAAPAVSAPIISAPALAVPPLNPATPLPTPTGDAAVVPAAPVVLAPAAPAAAAALIAPATPAPTAPTLVDVPNSNIPMLQVPPDENQPASNAPITLPKLETPETAALGEGKKSKKSKKQKAAKTPDVKFIAPSKPVAPLVPLTVPDEGGMLSPESRKIIEKSKVPSDRRKTGKLENIDIARQHDMQDLFKGGESAAVQHESMGIKIEVKTPKMNTDYELQKAYDALASGNSASAIELYKGVLANDPRNTNALFGLATLYHRARQLDMARPLYSRLLQIDPNNREGFNNFLVLLADEAPNEALTELEILESKNPGFSPIPAQIATMYQKLGNYDKATEKMLRAVALSPENLTYRYNLAIMMDKQKNYEEAAKLYRMLIEASQRGETIPGNVNNIQQRLTFITSNRP